mmetsp:Transcript_15661/g.16939  ORF Transcript_15661/g.16939 Transcript_15661/m.16939 type:complete len:92 (-) Transcript_15661:265-540(-)
MNLTRSFAVASTTIIIGLSKQSFGFVTKSVTRHYSTTLFLRIPSSQQTTEERKQHSNSNIMLDYEDESTLKNLLDLDRKGNQRALFLYDGG